MAPASSSASPSPVINNMPGIETIHASTVAIDGRGIMLMGPSGVGKSDLALRLIDRGALLVSDDYTRLTRTPSALLASAPMTIGGRLEIRGLGIVPVPHVDDVPVALAVRLLRDNMPAPERMPERLVETFAGIAVRLVNLDPRPASAPLVIEYALRHDFP